MNLYRRIRRRLWRASLRGVARGPHITRFSMYRQLAAVGARLERHYRSLLSISGSMRLAEVMGLEADEVTEAAYPEFDVLDLTFENESFDLVLSDQVLEHVAGSPERAVAELHRVLRPGGVLVHTTCLMNPVHNAPGDYWRFTPDGLALLHRDFSETIDCSGWGNQDVWNVVRDGMRFEGVPLASWHPLHKIAVRTDPLWPIVTWIVVRK